MTGPYAAQMSIEAMAREAGFGVNEHGAIGDGFWDFDEEVCKFAALVRAHALEEAARVCEAMQVHSDGKVGTQWDDGWDGCALNAAAAIRAIAATKP